MLHVMMYAARHDVCCACACRCPCPCVRSVPRRVRLCVCATYETAQTPSFVSRSRGMSKHTFKRMSVPRCIDRFIHVYTLNTVFAMPSTQPSTQARARACAHAHTCTYVRSTHACMHVCTHAHARNHAHMCLNPQVYTHAGCYASLSISTYG